MFDLPATFTLYLRTEGVSNITIKNYLADLNHFLGWLELFLRTRGFTFQRDSKDLGKHFNANTTEKYKIYLLANNLPSSTVNRRLSTLRNFAKFCLRQGWIFQNPLLGIPNLEGFSANGEKKQVTDQVQTEIINQFRNQLEKEKTSSNTIKSYLSDIREFLGFLSTIRT